MTGLSHLRGLGEQSAKALVAVGIIDSDALQKVGAIEAYRLLCDAAKRNGQTKPSLNFLYALVGAVEDRDWREVARQHKGELITALEAYDDFDEGFDAS